MRGALIPSLLIIFLHFSFNATAQVPHAFSENGMALNARITAYNILNHNKLINLCRIPIHNQDTLLTAMSAVWKISCSITSKPTSSNVFDIDLKFKCLSGEASDVAVSLDLALNNWSKSNYVLMPAAVYNGNREKSVRVPYCPFWVNPKDVGINKPQLLSDVPRLNIGEGASRIQQRSGDMSTPSIGVHNPMTKKGFWMFIEQGTRLGDNGLDIEENNLRNQAYISLTAPVVREQYQYFIADMQKPSSDKPSDFGPGDSITLHAVVHFFSSTDVQSLYNYFGDHRNDLLPAGQPNYNTPFSTAFPFQEEKFNRQNFESANGYYSVGLRENYYQDWQIGWTGGMISTYPLFVLGDKETRQNVIRNFDWLFPKGVSPSGYFWDSGQHGNEWFGIFQASHFMKDWHLIRKSGDGLYYILKQFEYFKSHQIEVKTEWEEGALTVAETFVKSWNTYQQLGMYVNNSTGELVIGGSTSGGIVPGALALASKYYNRPDLLEVAEEIATKYANENVATGLIYGGPGDALQNFDSESAYALLESFTVLYSVTGNLKWLKISGDMGKQYTTWVSSFDYKFTESSTLGKLGKKTTGAVWANTQNKHGAPGICTYSGVAFLRLYRATNNLLYLKLLQQIAQAIPQYLCTKENQIPGIQQGWISERISTTDWLEGIGEIMEGSTWAETSLMLTIAELPGVYIDTEKAIAVAFDQVKTEVVASSKKYMQVKITNPTRYDADISILKEGKSEKMVPIGNVPFSGLQHIRLKQGESALMKLCR